jgi:hypothetical protein
VVQVAVDLAAADDSSAVVNTLDPVPAVAADLTVLQGDPPVLVDEDAVPLLVVCAALARGDLCPALGR